MGAERNLPRKAKIISPHCPIFLHFLLLPYMYLVFRFIFPTFFELTFRHLPDLRSKVCPTYRHFNFSGGGGQLPRLVRLWSSND